MKFRQRLFIILAFSMAASVASAANIQGPKRGVMDKLAEQDAVRKRWLLRDSRFSVAPSLTMTMNDAFRRNAIVSAEFGYFFTDRMGIQLTTGFGVSYNSALADQLEAKRAESLSKGGFSDVSYLLLGELDYAPIYGKAAFAGRISVAYDMHFLVGGGLMGFEGDQGLSTSSPVVSVGVGLRVFLTRAISTSIQFRDFIVNRATNAAADFYDQNANPNVDQTKEWSNQFAITLSTSFYFPQAPKVGR